MFKLENFEKELMTEMSRKLSFNEKDNQFSINKLATAAEHLNVAAEIFEDVGMTKQAEVIISLLEKIAHDHDKYIDYPKQCSECGEDELNCFCDKCYECKQKPMNCVCGQECEECGKSPNKCKCGHEEETCEECFQPLDECECKYYEKFASVESLKKIKKDLKDSKLSSKELASLKKMIEQMDASDSSHLDDSNKKINTKKLVKNLKETGTLFSRKEYK